MLQIHNVQLRNFCQHDDLNLDFSGGITVILGPNGSGKSNLTNGIYSAFTGSFNRGPGDATKCIGMTGEKSAHVQVAGSIHGRTFRIRREITRGRDGQGKVSHGLWLDDQTHKTYKTAGEIESWLEQETGLSPEIMSYFLFPGQKGLSDYFSARASDRAEKFAALCGTRQYRKIRESYTKLLNEDRKRYDHARVTLEFLDRSLRDAEASYRAIEQDISDLQQQIGSADLKRLLQDRESQLAEITAARSRLQERENRLAALAKEYAIQEGHYEQAGRDCDEYEKSVSENERKQRELTDRNATIRKELDLELGGETYETVRDRLTVSVQANEKRALLEKNIEATDADLAAIPESRPVDHDENLKLRTELDTVLERIGSIDSEIVAITDVLPLLERLTISADRNCECPFCGAESIHWKKDIDWFRTRNEELRRQRTEISRHKTDLEIRIREMDRQQKQYESDQRQQASLRELKARQRRELDLCPAYDREAQARLLRLHELRHGLGQIETMFPELKTQAERNEEQLSLKRKLQLALNEKLRELEAEMMTLQTDTYQQRQQELERLNDEARRLEGEIGRIGDVSRRLTELEGSRTESLRQWNDFKRQEEEQSRIADGSGSAEQWFEHCESALDWFHHDRLPRMIHKSFLDKLVQTVNRNLTRYKNPFSVHVNEDVSFNIAFGDGQSRDSKALSVGESDLLGISFLGALNHMLAQKLGIMVIDEPTASLDAENLVSLFQVLEQWKKDLLRRNQQLVIVTHVEEMSGIADTVFRLPPRADQSLGSGRILLPV